jgi:hypothetical protein
MGYEHIDFGNWEAGSPLDEEHLRSCSACRENLELARFLKFQVEQVPRLDAPPFFAARVANLAKKTNPDSTPFWSLVELTSKRLIPAFTVLLLILFFFSSGTQVRQPTDEELWVALFTEPQISEAMTLDDILLSLQEPLEEEIEGQY